MGRIVVLVSVVFAFLSAAVWWLESRFGSGVAITVIGAILGVSALGIGYVLAMTSNRSALDAAASIYHSSAQADAARAGALRAAVQYGGQLDVIRERAALQADRRALPGPVAPAPAQVVDDWDDYAAWGGGPAGEPVDAFGAPARVYGQSVPFVPMQQAQPTPRNTGQFRIKFTE